jgi:hypothetical protein
MISWYDLDAILPEEPSEVLAESTSAESAAELVSTENSPTEASKSFLPQYSLPNQSLPTNDTGEDEIWLSNSRR